MESNHKRFVNFPVCNKEICIQQDWHVTSAYRYKRLLLLRFYSPHCKLVRLLMNDVAITTIL